MTATIPAPTPARRSPADAARTWARPLAAGMGVGVATALAAWWHPAAGAVVAGAAGALSWRLRGTALSPWRPRAAEKLPIAVADPSLADAAAGLRWRWDDACVNAGLARFVDDRYSTEGLALVGMSEHADGVIVHARPAPDQSDTMIAERAPDLAAGLEAKAAQVIGGDGTTIAILVTPPDAASAWT